MCLDVQWMLLNSNIDIGVVLICVFCTWNSNWLRCQALLNVLRVLYNYGISEKEFWTFSKTTKRLKMDVN